MLLRSHRLIRSLRCKPCPLHAKHACQLHATAKHYSTSSTEQKDVAILGGGITGLATAYYLSKSAPSSRITIYEAGPAIGGWLSSKSVPVDDGHVLFEGGPRTLRLVGNGKLAIRLVQDLGLLDETIFTSKKAAATRNRYFYYPDQLVALPSPGSGIFNIARSILSNPTLRLLFKRLLLEFAQKARDNDVEDESVGAFLARRIGSEIVDQLASAMFHGIYAGDIWQLSAKSLITSLWRAEVESGSLTMEFTRAMAEGPEMNLREMSFGTKMAEEFKTLVPSSLKARIGMSDVFTFRCGLQSLAWRLEEYLRETADVQFVTNAKVANVTKKDNNLSVAFSNASTRSQEPRDAVDLPSEATHTHVVSALSPGQLSSIVASKSLSSALAAIPTVTVMTVNLYYRTPNLHPEGFGYLIPLATPLEQNPERALGVVFDTSYSPRTRSSYVDQADWDGPAQDTVSNRGTKVTVMLGGHYWSDWPVYPSENEALQMSKSLLERHLGITEEPAAFSANLQKDCIPQYTVGHSRRLASAHDDLLKEYQGRFRVAGNWFKGVGVNDCLRSAWDLAHEFNEEGKTGLEAAVETPMYARKKPVTQREASKD